MSTKSPYPLHAFPRNWSAQDLTNAVPRKLSEQMTPALMNFGRDSEASNSVALSPWAFDWRQGGYLDRREHPAFRVR